MTTYSDPSQMNVHDDVLEQLLKLPPRELALELLRIAEDADTASTKNFLHYKFMPSDLILELGVHDLIDKGYTLPDDKREILVNMPFDDTMLAAQENVFLKGKKPKKTTDISDMTAFLQGIINDSAPKQAAEEKKQLPPRKLPFLKFDAELSHNVDGEGPAHRLIIGDNYHALAGMQASLSEHPRGVYDLVYIDPPYNTKDDKKSYSDSFPRTEWMSEQEPKLLLAKELLKETGVIFIAIGDDEQHTLRVMCDDVFGANNFISNIVWDGKTTKNDPHFIANMHDYMLVYAKNREFLKENVDKWMEHKSGVDAMHAAAQEAWNSSGDVEVAAQLYSKWRRSLDKSHPAKSNSGLEQYKYIDENGDLYCSAPVNWPNDTGGPRYEVLHPVTGKPVTIPNRGWRWTEERMARTIAEGRIIFGKDESSVPRQKLFLRDNESQKPRSAIRTDKGTPSTYVSTIIGKNVFGYPKDHVELARWFNIVASKDAKILDFFGGSGTTAEAVLLLNQQDGGTREVTIVTNDENNIGTNITRERIVRVMTGENWADGDVHKGYGGRLVVHRLGVSEVIAFDNCDSERKFHSWDRHAGEWGAWQDAPIPLVSRETHDVYTDGRGKHSIVFHSIDELRGTLVDEVLGEYPNAKVFMPFNKSNREAYIPDVPNSVMLPMGVVASIKRGITDSVLRPYNTRSAKYMDSVLNMLSKKNSEEEKETD